MPKTPDYFHRQDHHHHRRRERHRPRHRKHLRARRRQRGLRRPQRGRRKETAGEVNAKGSQALALKVDVTKRPQVEDMVKRSLDAFGDVQFLFNSAGAAIRRAKFMEIDDALIEKTFDLNVKGTLYGMQAVLPHMLENKFGVIVNVGSMAHRRGGPGSSIHYASAKGAVVTMTMGVAREFANAGIRALSISPGPIKTPFQDAAATSPELTSNSSTTSR